MKNIVFLLALVLTSLSHAQDITGQWHGILKVQGIQLSLVFNINQTDTGYSATMDSPDQGAKGIPVSSTEFYNSVLTLKIAAAGIEYQGTLNQENVLEGTFKQAGQSFPLNLSRKKQEKEIIKRPQEPSKPYPYHSEEVTFKNIEANIVLAGTLTLPKGEGPFPVVILISGSGPQDRNEELLGHKPFLVLADHLTKNGIGVLRYDDRGTAKSTGNFKTATSEDFANDVKSATSYLLARKEIDKDKIGLIGHSEGGIIAPQVAAKSSDISFIVLLAGTGIPGDQLLLMQQELIGEAFGMSKEELQTNRTLNKNIFKTIKKSTQNENLKTTLTMLIKEAIKNNPDSEIPEGVSEASVIQSQVAQLTSPWMQYFLKYNPALILEKVKYPVLAINGEKDLQVPSKINLEAIKLGLEKGGNKNITIKELPNLNHLFQECETGSPQEYAKIEQTFSPIALNIISNWILKEVKNIEK